MSLLVVECIASGCQWHTRGIKQKETELFLVKKFIDTHTCSLEFVNHGHKQALGRVIGDCIKAIYEGVGCVYRPKDIMQDMRREYGVNITYDKAWRARECALDSFHGSPEESFAYLPHYYAVLEINNPGTVTHIESDDENKFKYFFMAIGASLHGFQSSMHPVIVIDSTHLKGKYLGTLFVATALDGNEQIYPVAFGIVNYENNASWQWFFEKLRDVIAIEDFSRLCIISDRNPSIDRAVSLVSPGSFHGACIVHIQWNMKAQGFNESIILIYLKATKVYRISEFEHLMNQLRNVDGGRPYAYLVEAGFHRWSRALSSGKRYSIITTNITECLNAILRDVRIRKRSNRLQRLNVQPISHNKYYVRDGDQDGQVDLQNKTCSCQVFDLDQLPCVHALAACRVRNISFNSMCSLYYTNKAIMLAYVEPTYPVTIEDQRKVSEDNVLLPPATRRQGRGQGNEGSHHLVKL
ncbi:uncharacterized protein LOC120012484 [Tripterygium wilfordii]|uniref:uncharacterized protein LOC120012484 n=1 Tax=Tripterygium wilfordii TaxID=458696 RepID=UPI0018F7EB0B|nr:uncharacterized protein LOC120012484 [Tripterygium wilfordii]